jgi:hypothetical protein
MTAFATSVDLSTLLTGEVNADPVWNEQADRLLQVISDEMRERAGVKIDAGSGTHLLAGTWSRDLHLPQYPITDVTAVTVNGRNVPTGEWAWNQRALLRRGIDSFALDEPDASLYPDDWAEFGIQGATWRAGQHWGGPASTVAVTYSWGYEVVPDWLSSLCVRVAARSIGNIEQARQESLGVYSVTHAISVNDAGYLSDGEVRRIRRRLGRRSAGSFTVRGL